MQTHKGLQIHKQLQALQEAGKCRLKEKQHAKTLTTFGLGGLIELVVEPTSVIAASELLALFSDNKVEHKTIGAGSNVVISDNGIATPVIKLPKEFSKHHFIENFPDSLDSLEALLNESSSKPKEPKTDEKQKILIFAASSLMRISRLVSENGLSGLEFAAGIPASIGGACVMNAGAHGGQMSDCIKLVYVIDAKGCLQIRSAKDLDFSYRHSALSESDLVIAAGLELEQSEKDAVISKRKECLDYRKATQPLSMPSSGSVFINPKTNGEPVYSAELIEKVGLKGIEEGGVAFSSMHSNWLVKLNDDAKSSEFLYLVNKAKELVKEKFNVELKTEIKFWSDTSRE